MDTKRITTVKLKRDTKFSLDKLKVIERESYDEVIQRLIQSSSKEQLELNPKTRKVIPKKTQSVKEEKIKLFQNILKPREDNRKEVVALKKGDKKEEKVSSYFKYP
jgi:hypothetical protein